jgi:5-oxoprolinase (ATP-hydrolysing) subunit A
MTRIDLNCDLGEGAGHDAELMPFITSANIACGGHAGNVTSMRTALELAARHGVAAGAHPGFNDPAHFGRRELPMPPSEVHDLVVDQIRALLGVARVVGTGLVHVKPHGALYNLAARDPAVARAVAGAVREVDAQLVLYGLAGSRLPEAGRACGLRVASEIFADRSYEPDGSLTPRTETGALVVDEHAAAAQVLTALRDGWLRARDGTRLELRADTVCVHGDGPRAVTLARTLRTELTKAGIELRAPAPRE